MGSRVAHFQVVSQRQVLRQNVKRWRAQYLRNALFRPVGQAQHQGGRNEGLFVVTIRKHLGLLGGREQGRSRACRSPGAAVQERGQGQEFVQRGQLQDALAKVRRLPVRQGRPVHQVAARKGRGQVHRLVLQLRGVPHEGEANPGGQRGDQGERARLLLGTHRSQVCHHPRRNPVVERQFLRRQD